MRYPARAEILLLHRAILEPFGGTPGIRDLGARHAALAQPRLSFGDADAYPTLMATAGSSASPWSSSTRSSTATSASGHAAMETRAEWSPPLASTRASAACTPRDSFGCARLVALVLGRESVTLPASRRTPSGSAQNTRPWTSSCCSLSSSCHLYGVSRPAVEVFGGLARPLPSPENSRRIRFR